MHADPAVRAARVLARIDELNRDDPTVVVFEGVEQAKEPLHARLMTEWLQRLDPDADDLAHIAARGHHLRRWTRPRSEYPPGRKGYLQWRAAAQRAHAAEVGELMAAEGYGAHDVERVGAIIRKEGLGVDPVVQSHEDARCLVFLQTQLTDVADQLGDDAVVDVLARTLPKMSSRGAAEVATLELGVRGESLIADARLRLAERRS